MTESMIDALQGALREGWVEVCGRFATGDASDGHSGVATRKIY